MNRPLFPTTLSIPSYDIGKYLPDPPSKNTDGLLNTLKFVHKLSADIIKY